MEIQYNRRLGISYISDRENLDTLYNEEILIDKSMGMVSVKTPTLGNVISYNYHTRLNTNIHRLLMSAYNRSLSNSSILQITPDNVTLPIQIQPNTNILDTSVTLNGSATGIVISIDMDCFTPTVNGIVQHYIATIPITYKFTSYYQNNVVNTYSGTSTLDQFNINQFLIYDNIDSIVIDELTIGEIPNNPDVIFILNSICVFMGMYGLTPVSNIYIINEHTTNFYVGDTFNTTGLVVHAELADGSTVVCHDYTYTIYHNDQIVYNNIFTSTGTHKIIITYGNISRDYEFEVSELVLMSMSLAREPNTISYEIGDEFDSTGMELVGTYNNGITKEIPITSCSVTGFDSSKESSCCTVSITRDECCVTIDVEVLRCLYLYIENSDGTLTVIRYLGKNKRVVVPSEIVVNPDTGETKTVTVIGATCFDYSRVEYLEFPETVTTIE